MLFKRTKDEPIYYVKNDDQKLILASQKARDTFRYFWRELWWERRRTVPALDMACVKLEFKQESPLGSEFMWISDVSFNGIDVCGYLINEPTIVTNVKNGDFIKVKFEEIYDWMFSVRNKAYGGFTIQAMRSEMDSKARKAHDKASGLDFGDPTNIQVVFEQEKHPENLIEHPMCINMGDSLKTFLEEHPDEIFKKDEFGYTMLHWEAIAGNKTCVDILLATGADGDAVTNEGYTAAAFVKKMGWEHFN